MSASIGTSEKCEPNLVPILDMVFQLITFFILVVNFKATSVDHELELPVVGSAAPVVEESQSELLVLNIRSSGELRVRGEIQPNAKAFIAIEARTLANLHNVRQGSPLPVRVVLRGDRSLTVKSVLEIVDACRANGFEKFDFLVVRSASKEKGR